MREIKFRGWNKAKGRMKKEVFGGLRLAQQTYELMQYTGFKDKNGVEIYEGDILHDTLKYCDNKGFNRQVIFCEDTNGWVVDQYPADTYIDPEYDEVIGNIYENKELLDENNNNK